MSAKQVMLCCGGVLGVIVAVIMIIPATRHRAKALVLREAHERDRYLYQWVEDLESDDAETRLHAAGTIGNMLGGARDAVPDLIKTMRGDSDPHVRSNATFSIQRIAMEEHNAKEMHTRDRTLARDFPDLVPALTKALSDTEPWVRMNASMALHNLGSDAKGAVPELMAGVGRKENNRAVGSFTWTIREEMMIALGSVGPEAKDAVPLLKSALQEELDNTRRTAARALGKIGPDAKDALKELIEAANDDESEGVRTNAREAVGLIDPEAAKKLSAQ